MPWRTLSWRTRERLAGYGLVLPDLLGVAAFVVLPIGAAFAMSFTEWTGLSPARFVGLSNFQTLLSDPLFIRSLGTTSALCLAYVAGVYVLSLGLALLVNARLTASGFFRSAYFIPAMISPAVAAIVWSFIFGEREGILNMALVALGLPAARWLGSPDLALVSIAIVAVWQATAYAMIIQLAGLQDIPREYYEAAQVDGADGWTRFRRITLPLLKPTTAFIVVTATIDGFQLFDIIYVMTNGGPARATTTTVFYIYQSAFEYLKIGYASAMAIVLFAIIFGFSFLLLRLFRQPAAK